MNLREKALGQMKDAVRAKDAPRLATLRMLVAAIRQQEIDSRAELDDAGVVRVVERMVKQREESVALYLQGNRKDLADKERGEIAVLAEYLPPRMDGKELDALIGQAIAEAGAQSPKDMGRVMAILKGQVAGKADMGDVSRKVRERLAG